jgi:hypothetical protein
VKAGKKEYYIKWKGYSDKDCTWEPAENLSGCKQMVKEFERRNAIVDEGKEKPAPKKPQPRRREEDEERDEDGQHDPFEEKAKLTVLKRSLIEGEFVFKTRDNKSKKEIFMSREEILEMDPLALCLFYEKHIVT